MRHVVLFHLSWKAELLPMHLHIQKFCFLHVPRVQASQVAHITNTCANWSVCDSTNLFLLETWCRCCRRLSSWRPGGRSGSWWEKRGCGTSLPPGSNMSLESLWENCLGGPGVSGGQKRTSGRPSAICWRKKNFEWNKNVVTSLTVSKRTSFIITMTSINLFMRCSGTYRYVVGLTLMHLGWLPDSNLLASVTLFPNRQ